MRTNAGVVLFAQSLTYIIRYKVGVQLVVISPALMEQNVVPILKSESTKECGNYPPISVLSIISNLFEKAK